MDKVIQILFYSGEQGWVRDALKVSEEPASIPDESEPNHEAEKSMYLE